MTAKEPLEGINLSECWFILKRRWVPAAIVFLAVSTSAAIYGLLRQPIYQAEGTLLVTTDKTPFLTGIGQGIEQIETIGPSNPLETQIAIIKSNPILQATIEQLDLRDDQGHVAKRKEVLGHLEIKAMPGTEVLQIAYQSPDPAKAVDVVNTIINVYLEATIQSNRAEAIAARQFIAQQLPKTEQSVEDAERALRQFKEQNNVISLQNEANAAVDFIADLDRQIASIQAQLGSSRTRSDELRRQIGLNPQQALVVATLSQSAGVQEVLSQYQAVQQQLALAQSQLQDNHPTVIDLQEQVAALERLLQARIAEVAQFQVKSTTDLQLGTLRESLIADFIHEEIERQGLERELSLLSDAQTAYKERAGVLPALEQGQRELERQLQAAQTTYETLLTRLQEVQVTENQTIGNARIISSAVVSDDPVGPSKKFILASGVLAGLLLATATAFVLDLSDRSLKTTQNAIDSFQYRVLGVIPAFDQEGKLVSHAVRLPSSLPRLISQIAPQSAIAKAYQMLQANVQFFTVEHSVKSIVITSSVAQEGKSEVVANLAAAIAHSGCKTLIVDADFRQAAQQLVWGVPTTEGLSDLVQHATSVDTAILEITPNLHVLPAGRLPQNSVALLGSNSMTDLMKCLSHRYDYVIFDAPCLINHPDAAILGKLSDGIVLVVNPMVINRTEARLADEFLTQTQQMVIGMVLNGVNISYESESYAHFQHEENDLRRFAVG